MPSARPFARLSLASLLAATLAACGGSPSSPSPAPAPARAPAPATTLSVSQAQLAMAASGISRTVTVANTGLDPALDLATQATGLPPGTSVSASTCGALLPPGGSCSLTLTPGATPTAAPGDLAPSSGLLELAGSNTSTLSVTVSVITYGSVHQGGYVFAIDDSTPASGGIGGKVAALSDSSAPWSLSFSDVVGSESLTDGMSNTASIVADQGPGVYAAQLCVQTMNGYSDWYLPAVCELGYSQGGFCGTPGTPLLADNMQSRLVDNGNIGGLAGIYASSTQFSVAPATQMLSHQFAPGAGDTFALGKNNPLPVRCARALTP